MCFLSCARIRRITSFPYTTLFRSLDQRRPRSGGTLRQPRNGRRLRVAPGARDADGERSEEHTSELQSLRHLVCRLLLEKKKQKKRTKEGRIIQLKVKQEMARV